MVSSYCNIFSEHLAMKNVSWLCQYK